MKIYIVKDSYGEMVGVAETQEEVEAFCEICRDTEWVEVGTETTLPKIADPAGGLYRFEKTFGVYDLVTNVRQLERSTWDIDYKAGDVFSVVHKASFAYKGVRIHGFLMAYGENEAMALANKAADEYLQTNMEQIGIELQRIGYILSQVWQPEVKE